MAHKRVNGEREMPKLSAGIGFILFYPMEIIEILLGVRGEFICHSHTLSYFFFLSSFPCPFPTQFLTFLLVLGLRV